MYLYFILQDKVCDCDCEVRVESDKAIFVDFGTQEVILGDSIIQSQC